MNETNIQNKNKNKSRSKFLVLAIAVVAALALVASPLVAMNEVSMELKRLRISHYI